MVVGREPWGLTGFRKLINLVLGRRRGVQAQNAQQRRLHGGGHEGTLLSFLRRSDLGGDAPDVLRDAAVAPAQQAHQAAMPLRLGQVHGCGAVHSHSRRIGPVLQQSLHRRLAARVRRVVQGGVAALVRCVHLDLPPAAGAALAGQAAAAGGAAQGAAAGDGGQGAAAVQAAAACAAGGEGGPARGGAARGGAGQGGGALQEAPHPGAVPRGTGQHKGRGAIRQVCVQVSLVGQHLRPRAALRRDVQRRRPGAAQLRLQAGGAAAPQQSHLCGQHGVSLRRTRGGMQSGDAVVPPGVARLRPRREQLLHHARGARLRGEHQRMHHLLPAAVALAWPAAGTRPADGARRLAELGGPGGKQQSDCGVVAALRRQQQRALRPADGGVCGAARCQQHCNHIGVARRGGCQHGHCCGHLTVRGPAGQLQHDAHHTGLPVVSCQVQRCVGAGVPRLAGVAGGGGVGPGGQQGRQHGQMPALRRRHERRDAAVGSLLPRGTRPHQLQHLLQIPVLGGNIEQPVALLLGASLQRRL
mmetsp:Transcript_815/g.2521  ORF Transcript_815/g.2521 Transcript_815/m.2521 type:complete len:528 (+) Transcript_815:396-1979(+)